MGRAWAQFFRAHGVGTAAVDSFAPRGIDEVCTRAAGIALYPGCQSDRESRFYAPLLVLIGHADQVTSAAECEAMKAGQPPGAKKLEPVVYPEAPHTFDMPLPPRRVLGMRLGPDVAATEDARDRVFAFLAETG